MDQFCQWGTWFRKRESNLLKQNPILEWLLGQNSSLMRNSFLLNHINSWVFQSYRCFVTYSVLSIICSFQRMLPNISQQLRIGFVTIIKYWLFWATVMFVSEGKDCCQELNETLFKTNEQNLNPIFSWGLRSQIFSIFGFISICIHLF